MYAKLFASLYQGTLRGQAHEILVFTNLLAHATKEGTVDKHFRAIAEETGLTVEEVKTAIEVLESPDPESRSPEEGGARIVRLDDHRVWGWRIVNHGKYRAIRNEDDRAEQNRLAQQRFREKSKQSKQSKPPSAASNTGKPIQRQEAETETETEPNAEAERETERERLPTGSVLASPPVTLEQAKQAAPSMGVTPQAAEMWWLDRDGVGWIEKGHPIRNWRSNLTAYGRRWAANEHKNRRGKELPESETHYNHLAPDLF